MILTVLNFLTSEKTTVSNQSVSTGQPCSPSSLRSFGFAAGQYRAWITLVGTIMGLTVSHSAAQAASFTGLGFLPGVSPSAAPGVAADGAVVSGSADNQALRWTQSDGLVGLGFLPGGNSSSAAGVSADGSVVVGESVAPYPPVPPYFVSYLQPFRWTEAGGMQSLGLLGSANGVSADGSVVVGTYYPPKFNPQAIIWGGSLGGITYPYLSSSAHGVSADGSVVVGSATSVISSITEAARWTQPGGLQVLGLLPGSSSSSASGVSADGSLIVGQSGGEAFLWSNSQGMQSLTDVLIAAGVSNLTGWGLTNATAVSADGYTVVGYGSNPNGQTEAWIADLRKVQPIPTPALLPGLIGVSLATWRRRQQQSDASREVG